MGFALESPQDPLTKGFVMEQDRNIIVATDENFVVPTATTLRSLSLSDSGDITVWVLASGVTETSRHLIQKSIVGEHITLRWLDMTRATLGDTSRSSLGAATYFRLAVGEMLPASVTRALYMDTDILVADSLAPLWSLPDKGELAWAVRSVHYPSICTYGAMDRWPELGLDPRAPYFNAGVMMIDLDRWRELDVGGKALAHLASPLANGALADQEALNVVLSGHWTELDPRWNQQTPFLEKNRGVELLYPDEVVQAARQDPAVIHFLNRPKPWHRDCKHPARDAWRAIAQQTAFAPFHLQSDSVLSKARWRVRRASSALIKGM